MSVLSHLENLSSLLNIAERESGAIDRSINTIHTRLGSYFGADVKDRFRFGSSTRRTMLPRSADPNSDVDYMIVFDNSYGYTPQTFISRLKRFAEQYYSRSEIYQSSPTVVLILGHIKFDLVPAYKNWGSLYIPAPRSSFMSWMYTDPLSLNPVIDRANANCNYQLKPTVRLVKYWNALNDYVYESFELEQKLTNNTYWYCSNLKDYFYSAIESLSMADLPQYKRQKVERAKQLIANARQHERNYMPAFAESEIKKLVPSLI
jgi:hypothetical protein